MLTLRPITRPRAAKISSLVMRTARARLNPDTTIHKTINAKTASLYRLGTSAHGELVEPCGLSELSVQTHEKHEKEVRPLFRGRNARNTRKHPNVISDRLFFGFRGSRGY